MTATISISVPALTDNTVAFVNAAAWTNYWSGVGGDVEFDAIVVDAPVPIAYNSALAPYSITIDAETFIVPTLAQFTSLKSELQILQGAYINLLGELRTAGLITY